MQRSELEAELEKHQASSFGWALACCSWDHSEAEEVLQQSYLKILEGSARFGGRSAFRTWMFAVIRRTAAERRRRARVRRLALDRWLMRQPDPDGVSPQPPDLELQRSAQSAQLVCALRTLPARQREVLHLVFYADLTIEEAARALGLRVGTARTHYQRGKARLRARLELGEPTG